MSSGLHLLHPLQLGLEHVDARLSACCGGLRLPARPAVLLGLLVAVVLLCVLVAAAGGAVAGLEPSAVGT